MPIAAAKVTGSTQGRPRRTGRWEAVAGSIAIAMGVLAACAPRTVRVEVTASDEGAVRTFATNRLDEAEARRLEALYGVAPTRGRGGTTFTAAFEGALPEEIGNRNGLTEVRTSLGTSRMYWESFHEPRDLWGELRERQASGEVWVRIFGRWSEQQFDDESVRQRVRDAFETQYLPFARDTMLLFGSMQAVTQAHRVAASVRGPREFGPLTADERFRQAVFLPLLLMMAERGFFSAEEMQRLTLLSMNGAAAEAQRQWSLDRIILPAITRQIRRFQPDAPEATYPQLLAWGLSFYFFANSPARHADLLLASEAVPEEDKARLRAGQGGVSMPPAFGVRVRQQRPSTDAEVVLTTGVEPHLTNGTFDAERGAVVFRTRIFGPQDRVSLYPATFHASWATPDEVMQRRCFGEVLLRGADLAEYCGWQQALTPRMQQRLEEALAELAETGRATALRRIVEQLQSRHPPPEALVRWVRSQTI